MDDLTPQARAAVETLAYTIDQALIVLPIGRTKMFELVKNGQLRSVHIGRRRLIPRDALVELLERGAS